MDITKRSVSHFSHSVMSNSLRPHELQHARPPCPSPTPGVHSDSRPLSRWCHPAIPYIHSYIYILNHFLIYIYITSCKELTHWKRLWCLEGLGAEGKGDDRGWDGWMASPTQWTWVWVNSGSWWWTGRPGVLWFMGPQRVGQDWATELNWTELNSWSSSSSPTFNIKGREFPYAWYQIKFLLVISIHWPLHSTSWLWIPGSLCSVQSWVQLYIEVSPLQ